MTKQELYKLVFDDLMNNGPDLFKGMYDAVNGGEDFMDGISTVIEYIANNVSEKCGDEFNTLFFDNMSKSIEFAVNKNKEIFKED